MKSVNTTSEAMEEIEIEAHEQNIGDKGIEDEYINDENGSQVEKCSEFEDVELTKEDKRGIFECLHRVLAV